MTSKFAADELNSGAIALSYPLGLGLGLRLVLSRVSNRNPTPDLNGWGGGGYESAIAPSIQ